ncbi:MAG TPA: hypothetical protein VJ865_02545 [Gemmatimonadaceae bacterium]|nr:hypothetical protein [Gemmatimonadaceae bacterium]
MALYACVRAKDEHIASDSSATVKPAAQAGDTARPASRFAKTSSWTVNIRGIGPLHAGMSRREAAAVMGVSPAVIDSAWTDCDYVGFGDVPEGVSFMVEGGTIARVDVTKGRVATEEGARIGDSEDRIRQLYGSRLTVSPHAYVDGHYLIVHPKEPADSAFRIVFETDGHVVTQYRSGRLPPVEWVEGCS